jgi:putative phosphoesterase
LRLAVVSDVHGNLAALEAIVRDIESVGADFVVNAGDLVGSGPRPAEVVDLVRSLGWPGVCGNTDEVLWRPEPLHALAERFPNLKPTWDFVLEDAERTRASLGDARIAWLRSLPIKWSDDRLTIVHASPDDTWTSPSVAAPDDELRKVYGTLGTPLVAFGHLHVPFIRAMSDLVVANAGSAGMPYDGDPRASYLIVHDGRAEIRRVEYAIEAEIRAAKELSHPRAEWIASVLRDGRYLAPEPRAARGRP